MSDELRKQIHNDLDLRETEDLLEIWRANDRSAWSGVAFEELQKILTARLGKVPPQGEPPEAAEATEIEAEEGLEDWEIKALDAEPQPEFYDVLDVIWLRKTINRVLIGVIVINLLVGVAIFAGYDLYIVNLLGRQGGLVPVGHVLAVLVTVLDVGLKIAIAYVGLKALAHILRILLQMELNSREPTA